MYNLSSFCLDQLGGMGIGWSPCSIGTGIGFFKKLAQALWYLDPHHSKFCDRGIHVPDLFSMYKGYNDFKRKKEKEPRLSVDGLKLHIEQLSDVLIQPWMSNKRFDTVRHSIENLVAAMHAYKQYLVLQCEKVKAHQKESVSVIKEESNASLITLKGSAHSLPEYQEVKDKLLELPLYEPLFLNDMAPTDRYRRRKWLAELAFPFPVMLYKYSYGNNLGTLVYTWKIPIDGPVDDTIIGQVFSQLCHKQSYYSTRAMRREFLSKYSQLVKVPKMVLRNIYRTLLQDCSSAEYASEAQVDERVAKAVVELDDPEIIMDLRQMNGNPKATTFDVFWQELQLYLDEVTLAVDERRHGNILHMPLAISIRNLREIITARLKEKFPSSLPPIPSQEWLRLQFWPSNQFTNRAVRHTGRFKVKFGVQVRQLRKEHPDQHYVSALLKYAKCFAIKYQLKLLMLSVDDKCIVPVGEPNCPVSTGVRGHNHSLVPLEGPQLQALDHDFHLHGVVPSVTFVVDLPDDVSGSFFRGHAFVTNKDKITQPSNALRHATEITNLLRTHFSEDGRTCAMPLLLIVSDGGPDHRVTFGSVKVSSLTLFCALELDMLICVRTCPYQSWQNVAERIMSTLNLALQNVSLARTHMPENMEQLVKSCKSMSDIRAVLKKHPDLHGALQDSMSASLITLGQRFQNMKVKENPIRLGVPATQMDMDEQFQHALYIDTSLKPDSLTAKDLKSAPSLERFMENHCHASKYVFQVKKCTDVSCFYCQEHPIRLPEDVFHSLSFLPLPLLDNSKEHYKDFSIVYGQVPSDIDRPSRIPEPSEEAKELDKGRKSILVCGKVRAIVTCDECKKPRCIYSLSKLSPRELQEIELVKETNLYTCGSSLFPPDSPYHNRIVVRVSLVCSNNMEAQYYSSVLVHFPPVCYYCGLGEESLVNNEEMNELKESYAIVHPLCFICASDGKQPHCKQPGNVTKKRKTL